VDKEGFSVVILFPLEFSAQPEGLALLIWEWNND
jgi:hypothetical protein